MDTDRLDELFQIPARFMDITYQEVRTTSLLLKDGQTREVVAGTAAGIGVRVLGRTWGFVSANSPEGLRDRVEKAARLASTGRREISFNSSQAVEDRVRIRPGRDPGDVGMEEKRELLSRCEKLAREQEEVKSTSFSYTDYTIKTLYMNSEGTRIESEYPRVFFSAAAFAREGDRLQAGYERLGATAGFEAVEEVEEATGRAVERALRLLEAGAAPSGEFTVVLDPKLAGVFIHEALGHAAEADHVIQDESVLKGRLGEVIASEAVTVYDDPTLEGSFGFYHYDAEGTPGRKTALIQEGVLEGFLHSRETSSEMGLENTGNARAQSFAHQPVVRMSNTYFATGDSGFEEMVEDVREGVYLLGSKGGEVDPGGSSSSQPRRGS
ncbi:MAG: TldD/PmbA family protein [Euryarchaeota archaeon]|nr:TldD/PmbA family protein [Euryarchaeota archaeon]